MDSIVNPDFVEQTEDNWNLWESLQDSGEASLSDPDNKKYNMATDFGFSFSERMPHPASSSTISIRNRFILPSIFLM